MAPARAVDTLLYAESVTVSRTIWVVGGDLPTYN